ncbi:MAG: hypothetical protein GY838_11190 [bacterium]|nr:hypothetical protein [bacterium]
MNTSYLPRRLAVALAVVLLSAIAVLPALSAETIILPADPPAARAVTLEEMWRLGGEEDDEVLLGLVTGGVLDDDGNVLLVDRQLSQVLVISPEGELLDTLGREGDGPGEMRRPHSIFVAGDRVGIVQGFPAKVIFLDRQGLPAGEMSIGGDAAEGGFNFVEEVRWNGQALLAKSGRGTFDMESGKSSTRTTLSVLDLEGNLLADLVQHDEERDLQRFVFDEAGSWAEYAAWAVSPQGVAYTTAERDAWAVNVHDLEGNLVRTLRRPFEPRRRTEEDKDEQAAGMMVVINGQRQDIENKALDTDPAITGLHCAADGRLFAVNCWHDDSRLDQGVARCYDVVSPTGEYLEELTLTFPGLVPEKDAVIFLDGTHFLILRNFEDAQDAMRAGFDDGQEEEEEDLGDVEPLEVVFVRIPG